MVRYQYFVKRVQRPYTWFKTFHCIRVPEGDARIPALKDQYMPIGWCVFIPFPFKPTEAEETFELQKYFRTWDSEFEIVDPPKEMS
jgi:hypothetical protein